MLVVAGCGSSNKSAQTTSTQTSATVNWASGVCSAVTTYRTALTSAAHSLTSNPSKAGFQNAANEATSATNTFVSATTSLGKPNTNAGAQASQTLHSLNASLRKDVNDITAAKGESVAQRLATATAALTSAKSQVTAAVSDLKGLDAKGELGNAFSQAPSCSSLTA
jgi:hypothetical protein